MSPFRIPSRVLLAALAVAIAGCVTINIYFPAAAAEKAADAIIDEVWQMKPPRPGGPGAPAPGPRQGEAPMIRRFVSLRAGALAGAALAQGNLDIDTPAIAQFKAAMAQRHAQLLLWYQSGAVGLTRDGGVVLREPGAVPLAQRQAVTTLLAGENADRTGLYREIARANGNLAWEADIRATFAQRWVERAPAGWWVENATGIWRQKQ